MVMNSAMRTNTRQARTRRIGLVFSLILAATTATAQVRTFVSPAGLDTNPCTLTQPCRNFAAAIALVAPGGEVVALTSGGYGSVAIDKSVTLLAPEGVHAAIAPTTGSAITVETPEFTEQVVVRNLFLNAQGAAIGIEVISTGSIFIERCTILGFAEHGIHITPFSSGARAHVIDTMVARSGITGILVEAGENTLDGIEARENATGIQIQANAVVRNSVMASGTIGLRVLFSSRVTVERSIATHNEEGFVADFFSTVTLSRCAATFNSVRGLRASGNSAKMFVSRSNLVRNLLAVFTDTGGEIYSLGNNTSTGNSFEGTFTGTVPAK